MPTRPSGTALHGRNRALTHPAPRSRRLGRRRRAPQPEALGPANAAQPVFQPNFNADDLQEALDLVRQTGSAGSRLPRSARLPALSTALSPGATGAAQEWKRRRPPRRFWRTRLPSWTSICALCRTSSTKKSPAPSAVRRKRCRQALDYIRTLDPRPGLRYNKSQPRLIEPDVAFVKHGDEWLVMMNDDDVPQLRLNPGLQAPADPRRPTTKTRATTSKSATRAPSSSSRTSSSASRPSPRSAIAIVARQQDFLEKGIDQLKPMMIKEVAEEIGVHPSTVSRAVASKYAHTPQGVFELRYFFSESVNGPEGGSTSLLILKRRVKKLIEEEDPSRPLTDEQITRILQSQGIQVTRRTVAKYREDMRIPSTHQRRVKK